MRVLIDECLNWRLGRGLPGHFCTSVQRMGWSGMENGALLEKIRQERFEIFLTGDRNLQFQKHVPASGIAVVVLGRKHSVGRDASAYAEIVGTNKGVTSRHHHDYSRGKLSKPPSTPKPFAHRSPQRASFG